MNCECGVELVKTDEGKIMCPNGLCFLKFQSTKCPDCSEATKKLNAQQDKVGQYSFTCTKCKKKIIYHVGKAPHISGEPA